MLYNYKMTTYGDDLYCKTLNYKTLNPKPHETPGGTPGLDKVLAESGDGGGNPISNVTSITATGVIAAAGAGGSGGLQVFENATDANPTFGVTAIGDISAVRNITGANAIFTSRLEPTIITGVQHKVQQSTETSPTPIDLPSGVYTLYVTFVPGEQNFNKQTLTVNLPTIPPEFNPPADQTVLLPQNFVCWSDRDGGNAPTDIIYNLTLSATQAFITRQHTADFDVTSICRLSLGYYP